MVLQYLIVSKFYKWTSLQENHVLKLNTIMSIKYYRIQPEGIEQVNEGGHILFTPITIFGRDFGSYTIKSEKIGGTLILKTTSPIVTMIFITYK